MKQLNMDVKGGGKKCCEEHLFCLFFLNVDFYLAVHRNMCASDTIFAENKNLGES